jgi:hypothetical protein
VAIEEAIETNLSTVVGGTGTVSQACSVDLTLDVGGALATASVGVTDGVIGVSSGAETMSGLSFENTREASSLPEIDSTSFNSHSSKTITDFIASSHGSPHGRREGRIEISSSESADRSKFRGGRVDVTAMDGSKHTKGDQTNRVSRELTGNVGGVGTRGLVATFAGSSLCSVTIADFSEVSVGGGR